MTPELEQRLADLFDRFTDRKLTPDHPFYVPFVERMLGGDPIAHLRMRIAFSPVASVSLLTGMRGNGKSTALKRLKAELDARGMAVFLVDMRDYVHETQPIEITDFLISSMLALADAVRDRYAADVTSEGFFERLKRFLTTEVLFGDLGIEVGAEPFKVTLGAALATDPTFRERLQTHLRGRVTQVVREAHEFSNAVVQRVRQESGNAATKVVVLFDSLERIRGVGVEQARLVHQSVENVFSGFAESLHYPLMHVVYTIPPYLMPITPGLGRTLGGGTVCNLPSVHVRRRDGEADPAGLGVMHEIVERRCADWRQFIGERQLDRLAGATGGDLRDFFRALQACIVKAATTNGELPVGDAIVSSVEEDLRRDMLPLADEDVVWLRKIAQSKTAELDSIDNLPNLARFFDTHLILNYRNGDDWYDVHPLLARVIGPNA